MKKINFVLTFLLAWLTGGAALADDYTTVNNYVEAFENQFPADSNGPDFSPAAGWGHYAPGIEYNEGEFFHVKYNWMTPNYYYNIDGANRASIKIGDQFNYSNLTQRTEEDNDMLITPAITGASSIYVTDVGSSYDGGYLDVYVMKEENGQLVPDGKYILSIGDVNHAIRRYYPTKFELPTNKPEYAGKRFGLRGYKVQIAYFQAEKAEVPVLKKLGFSSLPTINKWANADENGNYTIAFKVKVNNAGTVDLAADDENSSVSVLDAQGNVITTQPVGVDLAVGESTDLDISYTRSYADYPNAETISLRSNIDGSVTALGSYTPSPHDATISLSDYLADEEIASGSEVYFGKTRTSVSKTFYLSNNGGSQLIVTDINLPGGFTSNVTADKPLVVADHSYGTFTVTLSADAVGAKGGTMRLVNDADIDFTLNLKAEVADENTWYADFEDMKAPVGSENELDSWKSGSKYTWSINGDYYYFTVSDKGGVDRKLIMPRLKFAEGETLELDAAHNSADGSLKVYYSADGNEWTLAKTIAGDQFSSFKKGDYYKFTRFVVDNIPAGSWYVAFASSSASIDNICGGQLDPAAHAWIVADSKMPAFTAVNSQYKAAVTLKNNNTKNEDGTTYDLTLYADGEEVAFANGVDLTTGSDADATHEFELAYTPHHTGEVALKLVIAANDDNYSKVVEGTATVNEETSVKDVQVGEVKTTDRSPFYLYDKNNECEVLLPASKLTDIAAGQKITGFTIKGKSYKDMNKKVQVWVENTTAESFDDPFTPSNTDDMTLVYDDTYSYKRTYEISKPEVIGDYLVINFTSPFVYEGGSLRLYLKSLHTTPTPNDFDSSAYFECDDNEGLVYKRNNDYDLNSAYWGSGRTPVFHFAVAQEPLQYTGAVTDKSGNTIAGADVTLRSGDVEYYATTGDDGTYTTNVVRSDLDYDVYVDAPGYKETTEPLADLTAPQTTKMSLYGFDLDAGDMVFVTFPFSVSAEEMDESDNKLYALTSVADGKAVFNKATSIVAYKPYLVLATKDQDAEDTGFDEFDEEIDLANEATTSVGGVDVVTYLSRRHLTAVDAKKSYHLFDNKFRAVDFASEDEAIFLYSYPFEAMLQAAGEADVIDVELSEVPTGISEVNASAAEANAKVYNVAGVRVSNKGVKGLKSGLYIKNGKKIVVK